MSDNILEAIQRHDGRSMIVLQYLYSHSKFKRIPNENSSENHRIEKPSFGTRHLEFIVKYLPNDDEKKFNDKLTSDYGAIIRESALLTSFAGFLFGFLLTISVSSSANFTPENKIILLIAISSITVSISFFVMPVIYHHLEYPYIDFEKFKKRSHRFILYGLVPAMITLFLGIELAMSSVLGNNIFAYLLGVIPFVLVGIFYRLRR